MLDGVQIKDINKVMMVIIIISIIINWPIGSH